MTRQVEVAENTVQLPDGYPRNAGDVVDLTDEQFAEIEAKWFAVNGPLIDRGQIQEVGAVQVIIAAGKSNVVLPNGETLNAGDVANLTKAQFDLIPASWFPGTVINNDDNLITINVPLVLADIVNGEIESIIPGFAGRLLDVDFLTTHAVTTAAKAATLTPYVAGEPNAGGVVSLASATATPAGKEIAGSAIVAARDEVQVVTLANAVSGTYTLALDGEETDPIAYNAASTTGGSSVRALLEALPNVGTGNVTVSGSAGGPYTVTFVVDLAATDQSLLVADVTALVGTPEVQHLVIDANGGTFTVSYGGDTTSALAFNVSGANFTTAMEALDSVSPGDVVVTGGPGDAGGTAPYVLTWDDALGNVAQITADGALLTGGAGTATPSTVTPGAAATVTPATTVTASRQDFEADEPISIVASSVTAFVEGEGVLRLLLLRT